MTKRILQKTICSSDKPTKDFFAKLPELSASTSTKKLIAREAEIDSASFSFDDEGDRDL